MQARYIANLQACYSLLCHKLLNRHELVPLMPEHDGCNLGFNTLVNCYAVHVLYDGYCWIKLKTYVPSNAILCYSIRHKKPVLTVTTEDVRDNPIMTLPSSTFKGPEVCTTVHCRMLPKGAKGATGRGIATVRPTKSATRGRRVYPCRTYKDVF